MKTYLKSIPPRGSFAASIALIALFAGGCKKDPPSESLGALAGTPSEQAKRADSTVIATFGDTEVSAAHFEAYLRYKRVAIRSEQELDQALDRYVRDEALALAAEKSNADKKEGGYSEAEFLAELAEFRRSTIQARYFSDFLAGTVTRSAVEEYYRDHGAEYEEERVRVAHILVRAQRATTDKERGEKKAKIDAAYAQLKSGKPFAEVAKTFSDDQVSGAQGGEMGWISKGAIDPRFSEVAFGLSAGAHSEPFETAFGYQIVKVLEGPEKTKKPLTVVEGQIRQKLRAAAKVAEEARLRELVPVKLNRGSWKPASLTQVSAPRPAAAQPAAAPAAEPAAPAAAVDSPTSKGE